MHSRLVQKEYWYKCSKSGCNSSFRFRYDLDRHNKIHDNDLDVCSYCPYRFIYSAHYIVHLKSHFRIRDYVCDQCDSKFTTEPMLNRHYQMHEGLSYNCLICNTYEAHCKSNIEGHLRHQHGDIVGKNFNWNIVKHHVKITS